MKYSRIDEVCEILYGKSLTNAKRLAGDFPVFGSSGIIGTNNEYLIEGPGIIIGRKGNVGKLYFTEKNFYPIDTVYYAKPKMKYNFKFLYYSLHMCNLEKLNSDAAVPGLKRSVVYAQEIATPPFATQNRITAILEAYDDLIENNLKRIKLLEEAAQMIYKEWFVNFRFPGYENTKFVDGLPVGWTKAQLKEIAFVTMGQSPESKYYNSTKEGLPFHQGVTNFTNRYVNHTIYCTMPKKIAEADDILFSVRAPVGRINLTDRRIIIGRGLCAIKHKLGFQNYLLSQLLDVFYQDNLLGNGSIFNSVTQAELLKVELMLPGDQIIELFESLITPLFKMMQNLQYQIDDLIQARDLLLPKLMTGEIEV